MTNLPNITSEQLDALKDFATSENKVLVDKLEEILTDVAKTGQYIFPWHFMKPLYAFKLDKVTAEFLDSNPPVNSEGGNDTAKIQELLEFRTMLLQTFDKFICAPFTIQRISELLANPKKHYKSTAKFFRGLEKNILVISTIDPVPPEQRPLLKRSRPEEITELNQNGTVDPPVKKSAPEETIETNTNVTTNFVNVQVNGAATSCQDNETESIDGLENMLLCKEQVNDDKTGENEEPKKVDNTEQNKVDNIKNEINGNEDISLQAIADVGVSVIETAGAVIDEDGLEEKTACLNMDKTLSDGNIMVSDTECSIESENETKVEKDVGVDVDSSKDVSMDSN